METKNAELKYEIVAQGAFVNRFWFDINFIVDEKEYLASCSYFNGYGLEDIIVENENGDEIDEDDAIYQLGHQLLCDMEITRNNVDW